MKKLFLLILVCAFAFALSAGSSEAGICYSCHTMHNSQDGAPMNFDNSTTPNAYLLRGNCWGCHGQGTASNIVTGIPQVRHSNATDLAGGNFAYIMGEKSVVTADTSTAGHNISFASVDEATLSAPPGDQYNQSIDATDTAGANALTCAGTKGCHGDRTNSDNDGAMRGSHHGDAYNAITAPTTVGNSYRFLYLVQGYEDGDWQNSTGASDHNEYKGLAAPAADVSSSSPGTGGSISGLCNECHGGFHGSTETGGSTPWLRHPTDYVIPNSGEYSGITAAGYNLTVPIARTDVSAVLSTSPANSSYVMCLSCHRAHATAYEDSLRWNYDAMNAGSGGGASGTGCFYCHTNKD